MNRSTGINFVTLKQMVYGVVKAQFPNHPFGADFIAQCVISANDYVDARVLYTVGQEESLTVAGQGAYTLWDSPVSVIDVTCNGKLLEEISHHEYLRKMSNTTSQTVVLYYARYANDLYLWPNPTVTGQAIVAYIHQSPPLLEANGDVPAVPPDMHPAIVDYALYLAFSQMPGQEQAASFRLQQFEAEMMRMETLIHNDRYSARVEPPPERGVGGGG
jgi:hypothetical protein